MSYDREAVARPCTRDGDGAGAGACCVMILWSRGDCVGVLSYSLHRSCTRPLFFFGSRVWACVWFSSLPFSITKGRLLCISPFGLVSPHTPSCRLISTPPSKFSLAPFNTLSSYLLCIRETLKLCFAVLASLGWLRLSSFLDSDSGDSLRTFVVNLPLPPRDSGVFLSLYISVFLSAFEHSMM